MTGIERRAYEAIGINPPKEGQMTVAGWMHTTFELNCFRNGYVKGATEQQKIVVDKLKEVMNRLMLDTKDKAEIIKVLEQDV